MPSGRHRYTPPRRLVIPLALSVCAAVTAGSALLTMDRADWAPGLLIALTAGAAIAGAVLMRKRDTDTDHRIAQERAARNTFSALADERESALTQAQERVTELEEKLQAKRIDLRRLRTEHADLLRRYALAEQGRANALEGRRQLKLEAARPTPALPSGPTDHRTRSGAPTPLTYLQAAQALQNLSRNVARQRQPQPPPPSQQQPVTPLAQRGGSPFDFFGNQRDTGILPAGTPDTDQGDAARGTETGQGDRVATGPGTGAAATVRSADSAAPTDHRPA